MLLGVDKAEDIKTEPLTAQRPLALVLGVGVFAVLATAIITSTDSVVRRGDGLSPTEVADPDANIRQIARSIFGDYVFAFEVVSILLLVAVVGTVLLTRRQRRVEVVSK